MDPRFLDALRRSGRFEIRRHLGAGGAGTVFEAYDRERDDAVALKLLHHLSSRSVYAFKREFRALADADHPNLVRLYELLTIDEAWFFTMELIGGKDFAEAVRHPDAPPYAEPGSHATTLVDRSSRGFADTADEPGFLAPPPTPLLVDEGALREALRQLASGLDALHRLGKLHRDLKPSNVMVTPEGRVVLLDFGLVRDLTSEGTESLLDGVVGTPAYMAPEQAAGLAVGPSCDWYAVGTMLYQVLTGRLPFPGKPLQVLVEKQQHEPVAPSRLSPGIPTDLDELCVELLRRDPTQRPSSDEVVARLGGVQVPRRPRSSSSTGASAGERLWVGREREIVRIEALCQPEAAGVALVLGRPGVGTSALLRRAAEIRRGRHDATIVLAGRCHLRESVPFKAFDGVVEALCRFLRRLPRSEVEVLLPYSVPALVRLFPLFDRVEAIAAAADRRVADVPDSQESRRRAFVAFRELLQRIGDRYPLVIAIDDVHRSDDDSLGLLVELLRPPDPPKALWLLGLREDDPGTGPVLAALGSSDLVGPRLRIEHIALGPLPQESATTLAARLLDQPTSSAAVERLVAETAGHPFLLVTLAERARRGVAGASTSAVTIEGVVLEDFADLSKDAQLLLEVVATAGRGLPSEVLREASGLGARLSAALAELRTRRIVRIRGTETVEAAHEQFGEIVSRAIAPQRRRELHLRLARALQTVGGADPHELAVHYDAAGEQARAADHAITAAEQAASSLAFDRAASIYRLALDLVRDDETRRRLRSRLGDALAAAGRGREAASAYLVAAQGALAAESLELQRRAAEQLLISGHIDDGVAAIGAVLASTGMSLAATPRRALFSILGRRLLLTLRGTRFKQRDASQVAAEQLIRIDTCWSVFVGLGIVDTIRGLDYGTRHLLLALRAGEPYRVARALGVEAGIVGTSGRRGAIRAERLVQRALRIARQVGSDHAAGLAMLMSGMVAYLGGRYTRARELFEEAEAILRERCTGVTWELDTATQFHLRALLYLGELDLLRQRVPELVRDARARGDLYAETNLRARLTWYLRLLEGDHEGAQRELGLAAAAWTHQGFHVQHYWQLTGEVESALWIGDPHAAFARVRERWPAMASSLLLRVEFTRLEVWLLRARAAIGAVAGSPADGSVWRAACEDARLALGQARKGRREWVGPLADLAEAGLCASVDDRESARRHLESAIAGCGEAGYTLHQLVAQMRRAQLIGASARADFEAHMAALTALEIASPERLLDVLAPGRWSAAGPAGPR